MDITIGVAQVYCCEDTHYTISHMIATEETYTTSTYKLQFTNC